MAPFKFVLPLFPADVLQEIYNTLTEMYKAATGGRRCARCDHRCASCATPLCVTLLHGRLMLLQPLQCLPNHMPCPHLHAQPTNQPSITV